MSPATGSAAPVVADGELATLPGAPAPEAAPPPQTLVGGEVGRYRIVRELGRGGMGIVYRAEHVVIGRPAAVKVLLPEYARHPDLARRFIDEARAAARITHPGIVQVYDVCTTADGVPCIVMEYLEGETLEQYAAGRKLPAEEALGLLLQLADVLGAAHAQGIAHRDVKPDNILLAKIQGAVRLKLLDFGIARLDLLTPGVTVPGTVVGTPWFMAPEQITGTGITSAVDVYAAGVVAYRLLTGKLPFDGESLPQVLQQHLLTPVPDAPELAGALGEVVRKALAKKPEDRFPTGHALRDALRGVQSAPARPKTPVPSAPEVSVDGRILHVRYATVEQLRRVHGEEIVKGRLFLPTSVAIPDGKLTLVLDAQGCTPLDYEAEAVFRVDPAHRAQTGLPAGVGLTLRRAAQQLQQSPPTERLDKVLFELESRSEVDPYGWLALRPDAAMSDVKAAVRARTSVLDAAYPSAPASQKGRITALRLKLERVRRHLDTPSERAVFDARVGNFRGVARCISAGLTHDKLQELRADFERQFPERLRRSAAEVLAADLHERAGRLQEALASLEQALAGDPLSLALQRRYWALKHRLACSSEAAPQDHK